ncbi:DNA-binding transcriptional regulator BolA-like [Amphiura filiformis]|uniref:DNA-binding transcriptional regulator BolA-like n=1 Tax=Amphiura filiformis TaxID=82378 RepID=UPI003B21CFD0
MLALRLTSSLLHRTATVPVAQQLLHKTCKRSFADNMANSGTVEKPVEKALIAKLTETFRPTYLEVINESHMHNVPEGSESHFKVVVVSDKFDEQNLITRHRMVHETLKNELCSAIHALSIQARTPVQWENDPSLSKSPPCAGGMAYEAKKNQDST